MATRADITPVPKDYDETDKLDGLIQEFKEVGTLMDKGYSFQINTFVFNTGEDLEEDLDSIKNILLSKIPHNKQLRIITLAN
ncbi:hypothetical protein N9J96_09300 [Paracoccaceae bacterium]|nr:hypothetical protein [Paracoccaceae bacterium]